jgi:hypothetical protein
LVANAQSSYALAFDGSGDYAKNPPAIHYLALVTLYLKRKEERLALSRVLLSALRSAIAPGNEPRMEGAQKAWHEHHISAIIAISKHIPEVWDNLSALELEKLEWIMRIGTYVGNLHFNAANISRHGTTLQWIGNKLPNQGNAVVAWMSYAYLYYGDAATVNAVLADYDYSTMISAIDAYGWSEMKSTFLGADTVAAMQGNFTYGVSPEQTIIGQNGVREPFIYKWLHICIFNLYIPSFF